MSAGRVGGDVEGGVSAKVEDVLFLVGPVRRCVAWYMWQGDDLDLRRPAVGPHDGQAFGNNDSVDIIGDENTRDVDGEREGVGHAGVVHRRHGLAELVRPVAGVGEEAVSGAAGPVVVGSVGGCRR